MVNNGENEMAQAEERGRGHFIRGFVELVKEFGFDFVSKGSMDFLA